MWIIHAGLIFRLSCEEQEYWHFSITRQSAPRDVGRISASAMRRVGAPERWLKSTRTRPRQTAHLTIANSRLQRTDRGQFQMCQAGSPSLIEKKIIWALPIRFSNGT